MASGTTNPFQDSLFFLQISLHRKTDVRLTVIRQVMDVYPGSDTRGSFTGSVSFITLDEQLATRFGTTDFTKIDIRSIEFFEITGPMFVLRSPGKLLADQKGSVFYFYGIDKDTVSKLVGRNLTIVTNGKEPINATVLSTPVSGLPDSLQLETGN